MRFKIFLISIVLVLQACNPSGEKLITNILWQQGVGNYNNYRIPSLIVTKNNTILAFAEGREGGDSGDIDILLRRSTDNGKTWSENIVVWDDSLNSCGNPSPVIDQQTGRIILFMTWNLGSDNEHDIIRKKSENTRIPYMSYSDDDGQTWTVPQNMAETCKVQEWGWYATGPGVGIQLQSGSYKGRLVIPCNNSYDDPSNKNRDGFGYGCHVLLSDDGGEQWRMSEIITPEVNESQVVELSDGSLLMNMRSYHEKGQRAIATSKDGGETWSAVTHDKELSEPVCQASIIKYGAFNDKNMFLFSNPATKNTRSQMTIKASFDYCEKWQQSKLIYAGPSAYSCLTRMPNGNVGLFFEAGETNPYEKMVFVSLKPSELFTENILLTTLD